MYSFGMSSVFRQSIARENPVIVSGFWSLWRMALSLFQMKALRASSIDGVLAIVAR